LRHCAALASTLVAGLELARDAVVTLEQDAAWATIQVTTRTEPGEPATGAGTAV